MAVLKRLSLSFLAVTTASAAHAADIIVDVPAPVPVEAPAPLFQGFAVGLAASGAVGSQATRRLAAPLKVLVVPGGAPAGAMGAPSVVNGQACSLTRAQDLQDGDIDCSNNNRSGTLTPLMGGAVDPAAPVGAADIRQFTVEQLLSGAAGVPLTPEARAQLVAEQQRLAAGEPLTGLFGFVGPSDIVGAPIIATAVDEEEIAGFGVGAELGYTFQFDRVTVGAQLVGGITQQSADFTYVPTGAFAQSQLVSPGQGVQELDYYGQARLTLGYVFDRFNPYVHGGLAAGHVDVTAFNPNTFATGSADDIEFGYTVGAGINFAATDNIILNLDYSYLDLGSNDYDLGPNFVLNGLETEAHIIRAGISFSFGG